MTTQVSPSLVRLRSARLEDRETLYQWQTKELRRYFNTPRPPSFAEHQSWFERRAAEAEPSLWIVEIAARPVGYVRLDWPAKDEGADVSILTDPAYQGRGIATSALLELRRLHPDLQLRAEIHPENVASRRAFEKAGYRAQSPTVMVSKPD
jgi:RimJ/RimL family protein N-acetyltransferase